MDEFKFCPKCGAKVKATAKFCPKCGFAFAQFNGGAPEDNSNQSQPVNSGSSNGGSWFSNHHHRNWVIGGILGVILVIVAVTVASSIITSQQTQAKKDAMIQSSALKASAKKEKQAKLNKTEKHLSNEAVSVVTNMVQNDMDLDASCDDVTITSSYGDNQYGGYADVSNDDGDQTTVDVTVTNVKYEDTVSVEIDSDGTDKLNDTFYSYDDDDYDY
ncbi:zinc-ribbon domain-containing protein [Lentilactobacillus otakiensis]|uniref:zinc-ribbon domain-containing protein n=1 Tax=Lentilactobacillus otakiensis TaxID=481720 RepID=UPI003D185F6B